MISYTVLPGSSFLNVLRSQRDFCLSFIGERCVKMNLEEEKLLDEIEM